MRLEEIKEIMKAMEENGLSSFEYQEGNIHISLRRGEGTTEYKQETEPVNEIKAENSINKENDETLEKNAPDKKNIEAGEPDKIVLSPLVGVFYKASSPEAEPFVKAGDRVSKGQVLGIVEAMKLMNEIESEYDGIVEAVLVDNEELVEYGQPLFRIR
ncbi:MAG: acetyl-CoA carboxylase biotin carboxyl carrier protein [Eubacteriales bacterium]|nr:acetyl-CoA carboxylase biotin carboxyl carrier protein [Eubacteriales bacterium]